METPPPFDPRDTQPIPSVGPQGYAPGAAPIPGAAPFPAASAAAVEPPQKPARFEHRFVNVGVYLLGRLGAFLIDVFAVTFLFATFGQQMSTAGYVALGARDAASFTLLMLGAFLCALLVLVVSEGIFGTTLGKLVFMLHVRRVDGRWSGPGRALLRAIFVPIDILLIGPLLALVTPRHQRIGDFVAGTVVGRSRVGVFSPILGVAIVALLGYAQIVYGGGITTALTIAAQGATYIPQFYRSATQPFAAVAPSPSPAAAPNAAQPANAAPSDPPAVAPSDPPAPTDAPTAEPTDAPATAAPEQTAAPAEATPGASETG